MSDPTANQPTDNAAAPEPPPAEVASTDVLANEPDAPNEDGTPKGPPTVTVRDREFRLRTAVPSTLLGRFASIAREAQRWEKKLPKIEGVDAVTIENPTPQQAEALTKIMGLQAQSYDALSNLIDAEDREDFQDWCDTVDPPIEGPEQQDIIRDVMMAISGRPTGPS